METDELIEHIRELEAALHTQTFVAVTAGYCSHEDEPWAGVLGLIPIDLNGDGEIDLETLYTVEEVVNKSIQNDLSDAYSDWKHDYEDEKEDTSIEAYVRENIKFYGGEVTKDRIKDAITRAIDYFKKYRQPGSKVGTSYKLTNYRDEYWGSESDNVIYLNIITL